VTFAKTFSAGRFWKKALDCGSRAAKRLARILPRKSHASD